MVEAEDELGMVIISVSD
jgi:hypothetical protein